MVPHLAKAVRRRSVLGLRPRPYDAGEFVVRGVHGLVDGVTLGDQLAVHLDERVEQRRYVVAAGLFGDSAFIGILVGRAQVEHSVSAGPDGRFVDGEGHDVPRSTALVSRWSRNDSRKVALSS